MCVSQGQKIVATSLIFLLTSCGQDIGANITATPSGIDTIASNADRVSSGIEVIEAPQDICPSGGNVILIYKDQNADGERQNTESVLSANPICNGVAGTNGNNGVDGQNGANGQNGQDGAAGSDGADGMNGQNAVFTMGKVGSAVAGKSYSACHHDYLYFPNASDPARGWLTFRHQGNGSLDQGIGSTGFQVWNVDIANFALASEVGNVSYCSLQYDAASGTLNYTVLDKSDGLQGESGTIQLRP
jgi:hypothetical protein